MDVVNKRTTSATLALGRTRNLLLSSLSSRREDQLEREARAIADCGRDDEGREGVAAFLARRKPDFKGNHHG
jgi:2-(1,2-epoxy-1,2-dihydrophenyl)acetyl-CoA isomerase